MKKGEPRRHYAYLLIDPTDAPYCTFRYHLGATVATPRSSVSSISSPKRRTAGAVSRESSHAEDELKRRISVPPRLQLLPSTTRYEPSSPIKSMDTNPASTVSTRQRPTVESRAGGSNAARRRWAVRTPSPTQADRRDVEGSNTPPSSARSKTGSISLLRGVIANALKRKDESGSGSGGSQSPS